MFNHFYEIQRQPQADNEAYSPTLYDANKAIARLDPHGKSFSGVIFPPAHVKSVLSLRATAQKQKGRKTFSSHIFIIIKFLGALFAEIISPEKSSNSHTCMDTQKFN